MKTVIFFLQLFTIHLFVSAVLHAQIPEWENPVQLNISSGHTVESAFSNGYGQHVAVSRISDMRHYLLGNDGTTIFQSSSFGDPGSLISAVTGFGAYVNVVATHHVSTSHDVIWLWRSSNGGEDWPSSPIEFDPITPFPSDAAVTTLDAYADARGIHIVWASANAEVYYVLYDPSISLFRFLQQVTDLGSGTGNWPRIVTSANKVHVVFQRKNVSPSINSTRDGDFSTSPPTWESNYKDVTITPTSGDGVRYQSIVRSGDTLHVISYEYNSGGAHYMHASKRHIDGSSWPTATNLGAYWLGNFDGKRSIAVLGDAIYLSYPPYTGNDLLLKTYKPATGWSASEVIESGAGPYRLQTVSSSRTGVYFYWHLGTPVASAWMKRKVAALSGNISENMFLTGNNWISGSATIEPNYTITLKSGSVTTFNASAQLTLGSGTTLIVEPTAQLVMGTGSKLIVETGATVRVLMNATLTIPSAGTLQANEGAQFKFGPGSSGLLSYGQLNAFGSLNASVVFASVYGSGGTWSGMTLSGSGANGSTLQYATVANVLTYGGSAVNVLGASNVTVNNCNISGNNSNGTNGLYLYNASDAMIGYNTITSNAGNGIRIDETGYAYVFNNTIRNNLNAGVYIVHSTMAFGNPWSAGGGRNSIIGGSYGVEALWYSYPWMGSVGNQWVGLNSVCSNTSYRVHAADNSLVAADWNWWGTMSPTSLLFWEESKGRITWENFLGYDPNGTCSGNGPAGTKGNPEAITNSVTDTGDVIFRALRELNNRNRVAARSLLQGAIVSNPISEQSTKAAAILSHMFRDSLDLDVFGIMSRLWQQQRANHPVFGHAIAKMLQKQRRITEAATILNALAAGNRNTMYEKRALLSLFYMYMTSAQHASLSGAVLQQLQTRFADDPEVKHAAWIYGVASGSNSSLGRIAVEQQQTVQPAEFKLEQNYPNPFNPTTNIRFAIPQNEHVTLKVFDVLGREVVTLVNGELNAGHHEAVFDASKLASGLYIYKVSAGNFTAVKKLLLLR